MPTDHAEEEKFGCCLARSQTRLTTNTPTLTIRERFLTNLTHCYQDFYASSTLSVIRKLNFHASLDVTRNFENDDYDGDGYDYVI